MLWCKNGVSRIQLKIVLTNTKGPTKYFVKDSFLYSQYIEACSAVTRPGKNRLLAVCLFILYLGCLFLNDGCSWDGTYTGQGISTVHLKKKMEPKYQKMGSIWPIWLVPFVSPYENLQ